MNPEMKKKVLTIAAAVICLAILGTGTLAYFADSALVHNVITSAGVDIELVEQTLKDGQYVPFPEKGIPGVMPGSAISKKVTVKSTADSAPAWIRIQVTSDDLDLMTLDINSAKWHKQGDFYYYMDILPGGAETEPLFRTVSFAEEMGNEYQNRELHLSLLAEAVQSDNNTPASGNPWEAGGWNVIQPLMRKIFN